MDHLQKRNSRSLGAARVQDLSTLSVRNFESYEVDSLDHPSKQTHFENQLLKRTMGEVCSLRERTFERQISESLMRSCRMADYVRLPPAFRRGVD